ncbi:MAG: protein-(glutamine-N5) methyltransferase, release factor-specific [Candidatus Magasanikbacteria bacterium RIFCSPLOWO2_12_FULL_43_12]|uniref:Protein-(Glutamine-N5) methyltransferase, release factor-specific n=1 Tax=Candidatus Magasanikbacteria bacterium RIFCSPLOWO2_12_FULL_43_12 TaxID=1798692 RepID=A0A1F6MRG9_9BACT|nr:MAG: protein-(glutamine-N5) methyltransferase, release factor-specific [Candidatus Magasanikbacteria bacterium RIFCSPLOWO2_12_FULL_43_12]
MRQTTIKQLLQQARERIDLLDAELIIAFVLKKTREFVIAHGECGVRKFASAQVCKLIRKRERGEPLAYLTGHKDFFGLDFAVNKSVLVPRPETEVLVESVIECLMTEDIGHRTILIDVGTGSGCIPIAITKSLHHHITSSLKIFAIDISKVALRIARLNAKKHGVKIKFLHGSLLTPLLKTCKLARPQTHALIITANLPYLTLKQYRQSASIKREPKNALVAGKTGLGLYEKLLKQIRSPISNIQYPISVFFEIDPSQSKPIVRLIEKYLPKAVVEIKKDLSGRDRVVETIYFA